MCVLLAVSVVLATARDHAGHVALAIALTPRRRRLFAARALAPTVVGSSAVVLVTTAVAGAANFLAAGAYIEWALLSVVLVVVATASLCLLAFSLATLARRSGVSVLVFMALFLLPSAIAATVSGLLPSGLARLAGLIADATPAGLLIRATSASTVPSQGMLEVLNGQIGLAAWALTAATLAGVTFIRRDA